MDSVHILSRHRLSVEQFHEMGRAGILAEDSRVELIDGELIDMAPIGSRHASVVSQLTMLLSRQCDEAIVFPQNPIALPPFSEPQPDIAVLAPATHGYREALPGASDVLLVIEVADTTLRYDRVVKAGLYARHGIREFWIVNLPDELLEVNRSPDMAAGSYRLRAVLTSGDVAVPEALPEIGVPLQSVVGR
jgi:Uma2 family endonuclease